MPKQVSFGESVSHKRKTRSKSHHEPLQSILRSPANKENISMNIGEMESDGFRVILAPRKMEFDSEEAISAEGFLGPEIPSPPKRSRITKRRRTTASDGQPLSRELNGLKINLPNMEVKSSKRESKPTQKYQAELPKTTPKNTIPKIGKENRIDQPVDKKKTSKAPRASKRTTVIAPEPQVQIPNVQKEAEILPTPAPATTAPIIHELQSHRPLKESVLFAPLSKAKRHEISDKVIYDQLAPNVGIIKLKGKNVNNIVKKVSILIF